MTIDGVMKTKLQTYALTKSTLATIQRKNAGNLSIRTLNDLVKKEHFVLDSDYLTTLLVAVPKYFISNFRVSIKDWIDEYELMTQMVVPRSSIKITEDDEYALFNVTLFRKVVEDFTNVAKDKKFVVRDFKWNAEQLSEEKKKYSELITAERDQLVRFVDL